VRLHQFTLDALTETGYDKGQYFFYYNNANRLQAWTVERKNSSTTEIKSFSEKKPGFMELGDIHMTKLPMALQGIKEKGQLIFETQKGTLECVIESQRIRITAKEKPVGKNKSELNETNSRFPGMIRSDIYELNDICLSRFTSCSSQNDEEKIFEESILLLQKKNKKWLAETDEMILVGPAIIDHKLQLIPAHHITLFEIPISDFNLEYQSRNENVKIMGWNQKNVEVIDTKISKCTEKDPFSLVTRWKFATNGAVLEDISTKSLGGWQRLIVWRDLLNPCNFYCLRKS
tara:strand:+ start:593 stop:1459 length:867 start_codon:yes stop_codon:yes gene_type:complete